VLGDVLGEGVLCRRRRLSCSARTRLSARCAGARLSVLHVTLPWAGAFGQVREGMRVDHGDKFGHRVAVKIISRRLIKKVSSPRAGPHSLQRAGAILDPMRAQRVGCGHSDSADRPDRLRLCARSAAGATEPTAIDGAPGRVGFVRGAVDMLSVYPQAQHFHLPTLPAPPYERGTLVCALISGAGMCAHTPHEATSVCGAARIRGASAGIPCFRCWYKLLMTSRADRCATATRI